MKNPLLYQVNFLPWRQQKIVKKKREFLLFTCALCCSTLTTCYFLYLFQQNGIESKQVILHNAQKKHQQIQQISQQMVNQQAQLNLLIEKQHNRKTIQQNNHALLALLHSLPTITPSKSWLTSFQLINNQLDIKTNSYDFQNIAIFSQQLENLKSISGIQLKQLSRNQQLNRLHITAKHQGEVDE
ncbi:PilN domain-containing protein [Providencia rettgeri]|uniref:PilN domain-containing protein n=1 Tax=Providencia rettgeri TaxID=587 RepID=UPI0034E07E92